MSTFAILIRSVVIVIIGLIGTMIYVVEAMWIMASAYAVKIRVQRRKCTLFECRRQNKAFEEMTHCTAWWVMLIILPIAGKIISVAYDWLNTIAW